MFKRSSVFVTVLLLIAAVPAIAQTTANLTGTVTSGGSALPGVTVTISSPQMQGTRTAVSGEAGGYNFSGIPAGTYKVVFELSGMTNVTKTTQIGVGQTGKVDADLKVAAVTEAITVTASAPSVLATPTVSQNLTSKLTQTLPTSRTVLGTAALAPGVNTNTASGSQLSISGSPGYDNLVMVNGVVITENVRSQALPLFIEDAIQETTVMTGAISAEYGRFTGGVVNSISKSGGNQFSGSFRQSLSNPAWTSRTPLQKTNNAVINSKLNRISQETLGGYILKDRLWFFGAGRQTKSDAAFNLRHIPGDPNPLGLAGVTSTDEHRYEGKLTGQITSAHNLAGSYLQTTSRTANSFFTSTSYDANQLVPRLDPYKLKNINYNGVITNNWLVEALWSKMFWGVAWGSGATASDFINGTLVRNRADSNARFNSATFCGVCDKETRTNDTGNLKTSYFLSTKGLGNMNLAGGLEKFREHRHANNYQSGSNFRFFVNNVRFNNGNIYPVICPPATAGTPNAGCSGGTSVSENSATFLIWTPIFSLQQGESNLETQSAYINDRWDFNEHWNFNVGVRFDKNHAVNGSGQTVSKDHRLSPRLSATYDLGGNGKHRFTASYGDYASRIVEGPGTSSSSAGSPGYIYYRYSGPAINPAGTPTDQLLDTHAALALVQQWLNGACNSAGKCGTANTDLIRLIGPRGTASSVPGFDVNIGSNLRSPIVREKTIGYGASWLSNLVTRVDFVARDWKDFYGFAINQNTVTQQKDPYLGLTHDVQTVINTNDVSRKYRGIQFQTAYRPRPFDFGLNYTWSKLTGNDYQESANNGTVGNAPGTIFYPEWNNFANFQPNGYLPGDQRHRVRAWASYDLPLPRVVGLTTVSVLHNYDSGLPYSATAAIDLSPYNFNPANSKYTATPTSSSYFFSAPGAYRTQATQSTNLSVNWERSISRFAVFAHFDFFNVFNRHGIVAPAQIVTTVNTANNSSTFAPFNPFTTTPIECPQGAAAADCKAMGANWQKASNFGQLASNSAYQSARSHSFNVGFRF